MKNKKSKIGILGCGEVGKALYHLHDNRYDVRLKDIKGHDDDFTGIEVLNICIPWSNTFLKTVALTITKFQPDLTIIHSTVPVHTTEDVQETQRDDWYTVGGKKRHVVHSPVRGVHPYLKESLTTFTKYVGSLDLQGRDLAKKYLTDLGMTVKDLDAKTTEMGKLLSTSYYGLLIAWHGEMEKMCDHWGLIYENVVTDFNETYNEGYIKMGRTDVVRPTLTPPEEGIGGHCIIPNAEILALLHDSKALDLILEYKK